MSLYNMIFGMNPYADLLLAMLGKKRGDCGRYRDCYTNEDGTQIIIHTRNGGGNRDDYQDVIDELAKHPCYLSDNDDDFDCTYANIIFSVPPEFVNAVKKISDATDTTPSAERWQKLISDMESKKDNATVSRALEIGKEIFAAVEQNQSKEIKTSEGSIFVQSSQ